jgi:filamentous hemagglutinin
MPLLAAELEVDGTTNTTLDTSRNDIPIVNIANPNAKGLSHNKFTKYNVGTKGLILNNGKTTEVNTQLGGYIYGNTNLVNNAKVILNEVTSNHRSSLNGYTEIAGQKADLIIANPNGLSINGAGFINTSNITLTTGKANIVNGEIGSYSINGGDISIEGSGLNTEAQNYTAIYTHFLKLNANINAKELDIKLGLNEIDNTTKQITSSTNSNEIDKLLLDSSLLGGMYAHKIQLVGTDKGLGVNLPPEVLASSGEITITNDGKIVLHKLNATEDITIDSKSDDITLNDNIYTPKDLNITTPKNIIANNGVIKSDANFTLKADTLTNKATLSSHRLTIDTNELNNTNKIGANHLTINNKNNITNSGYIEGNNTFTITSNTFTPLSIRAVYWSCWDLISFSKNAFPLWLNI